MKNTLLILSILYSTFFFAQEKDSKIIANEIKTIGKYTNGLGMELRWFPNSRALFKMGMENGYVLERADFISKDEGYSPYKKIKEIKPYTKEKWNKVIKENPNKENNLRELASEFIEDVYDEKAEKLIFNGNTFSLKSIKHKQDNEFSFLTFMTFQDKEVALGIGLGTVDNTIIEGKQYQYRVVINKSNQPNKTALQNIICRVTNVVAIQSPKPVNGSIGVIEKDGALSIIWEDTPDLVGYYIERSESENASNYVSLTKAPLMFLKGKEYKGVLSGAFKDEDVVNGKEYFYKVYANTLFGEKVLAGKVKGTPKDLTPPKTPYLENPKHNKDKVELKWKFLSDSEIDLKGFDVFRSDKHDGEYVKLNSALLPKNERTLIDFDYSEKGSNYYKVMAYDTNDNASSSPPAYAVIIDDTHPKKPSGIVASINKEGVVQIVIPKQEDDDIIGYKIFKANQEDHEFSVVEEVFPSNRTPLFVKEDKKVFSEKVPLKTLTPTIFYKVKMYDRNFNQSEFSDVIKIVKPDIVPPSSAIIKSVKVNLKNVAIELIKPSSKDLKVVNLYRKGEKEAWKLIYASSNKEIVSSYIDKEIEPNKKYYYRVQAVDENDLKSKFSSSISVKTINFEVINPVKSIKASRKGKQINVSWSYRENKEEVFFVVYRKINKGVFKQIGRSNNSKYIDKRPKKGNMSYAVKVMHKNGNSSKLSKEEMIRN